MSIYDEVTPAWLKSVFLFGVDLTNDAGEPYPDELFAQCIESAIKLVEGELQLKLDASWIEDEKHEYYTPHDSPTWDLISLNERPVRQIESLGMYQGNAQIASIPAEWWVVEDALAAQVSLVPQGQGLTVNLASLLTPGGPYLVMRGAGYQPGFWRVNYQAGFLTQTGSLAVNANGTYTVTLDPAALSSDYRTGFAIVDGDGDPVTGATAKIVQGSRRKGSFQVAVAGLPAGAYTLLWTMSEVPRDILQCLGWLASMLPLDTAGDLIAGAGIASFSVSLDGYSESVSTTSSATNAGYGARILSYQKQLKDAWPRLRARYGPAVRVGDV